MKPPPKRRGRRAIDGEWMLLQTQILMATGLSVAKARSIAAELAIDDHIRYKLDFGGLGGC